ncbi:2-oxo acid dehydrogenase subunit E2 [Micromonospora sp. NPDC023956]|uniref:2-oxo acid dehydrogenase subunit E2 n=1 Tax=Micromonospora sp. NPDC023956 TaxID=3155722 RepID=UPI0033FF0AFE
MGIAVASPAGLMVPVIRDADRTSVTAIIDPPRGAILAVGAAAPEPTLSGKILEARHRMRYTLTADHRVIDGALAAQFLATRTDLLEHPLRIVA